MNNIIPTILVRTEVIVILLACLVGVMRWKNLSPGFKIIHLQVMLSAVAELVGYYIAWRGKPNIWFFNIYLLTDFWIMAWAGSLLLGKRSRYIILCAMLLCTAAWLLFIYFHDINIFFANWIFMLGGLIVNVIYISLLIRESGNMMDGLFGQPLLWLCLGIILYYGCTIPFFGFYNYFVASNHAIGRTMFVCINITCSIARYILIAVSFILCKRRDAVVIKAQYEGQ